MDISQLKELNLLKRLKILEDLKAKTIALYGFIYKTDSTKTHYHNLNGGYFVLT